MLGYGVTGNILMVKMDWRGLILVVVLGVCTGLVSGFVENPPEASVIGHKYYDYPLVWRVTKWFWAKNICILIAIASVIAVFAWGHRNG